MKVALVCPYDLGAPGGVQSHVRALAGALLAAGDDVAVVAAGEPPGGAAPGVRNEDGVLVTRVGSTAAVPFNDSRAPIPIDPRAGRRARHAVDDFRPDVVHVHEPAVPWVSLAVMRRAPAPVVATFHAYSDAALLYRLARPLVAPAVGRAAALVAVSDAAQRYHAAALRIEEGRIRVIPNGVDVDRFAHAEPLDDLAADRRPTLLFVGRLERRKGLPTLIRAFLRGKRDRPDLRLLVVGDGPLRDDVTRLLPERLRADVHLFGRVDDRELPRLFASCDLFVSPASGGESFGIVLVEAMAAGAVVVASDIAGYRSVVTDGVDGRLVPADDPVALADTIGALLDNDRLRASLAREARRTARRFDWPVVAGRLREVYAEVAD